MTGRINPRLNRVGTAPKPKRVRRPWTEQPAALLLSPLGIPTQPDQDRSTT